MISISKMLSKLTQNRFRFQFLKKQNKIMSLINAFELYILDYAKFAILVIFHLMSNKLKLGQK